MTPSKARNLIWQAKQNIGKILTEFRKNSPPDSKQEFRQLLGANMADLRRLYKSYPQFAPVRVRQTRLKLF